MRLEMMLVCCQAVGDKILYHQPRLQLTIIFECDPTHFHQSRRRDSLTRSRLYHRVLDTCVEFLCLFAFSSSRFCSAGNVDMFTSARRRLTITLKAVSGSGVLHICCIVSSSKEKLTVANQLLASFCEGSTKFASIVGFAFLCPGFDRKPSTVQHVRHPCSTEHTVVIVQISRHLLPNHVDKRERELERRNRTSALVRFRHVHRGPMDLEGVCSCTTSGHCL